MTPQRAALATLVAMVALGVVWGSLSLLGLTAQPAPTAPTAPSMGPTREPRAEVEAARILAEWDQQRSSAWAHGDAAGLASLYVDGSSAAVADVSMLRRWQRRGVHVRGLRTQVLRLEVLERGRDRWVLDVTDRVIGGRAVQGARTQVLPTDAATRRRIDLRRRDGRWLVAEVSPLR